MKDKIKNIAEKLEHQIRMHELDLNDRIKDIPQIILLLEQGFSELKEIVSFYKFKSEMDEIFFFKIIKPKFFSKLIYYRKVYNIEMMRLIIFFSYSLFFSYKKAQTYAIRFTVHHKPSSNMGCLRPYGCSPNIDDLLFYLRW